MLSMNTHNQISSYNTITASSGHNLQISQLTLDSVIQIGELRMSTIQFELCLRHLIEMTKKEYPEEFI